MLPQSLIMVLYHGEDIRVLSRILCVVRLIEPVDARNLNLRHIASWGLLKSFILGIEIMSCDRVTEHLYCFCSLLPEH